jgi:hypothetical protein
LEFFARDAGEFVEQVRRFFRWVAVAQWQWQWLCGSGSGCVAVGGVLCFLNGGDWSSIEQVRGTFVIMWQWQFGSGGGNVAMWQ